MRFSKKKPDKPGVYAISYNGKELYGIFCIEDKNIDKYHDGRDIFFCYLSEIPHIEPYEELKPLTEIDILGAILAKKTVYYYSHDKKKRYKGIIVNIGCNNSGVNVLFFGSSIGCCDHVSETIYLCHGNFYDRLDNA